MVNLPRGRKVLDAAARAAAPGSFVELSEGLTHYEAVGPAEGQPVVLIPGFSVPSFVWSPVFEALGQVGFRTVRYDLFGRGYSDRPRGRYDLARFVRQLADLTIALDLGTPVNVVGLSMGGAIAVGFADQYPEQVAHLALIDPAGMPMPTPWWMRWLHVPLLGELLMVMVGRRVLVNGLIRDFPMSEKLPELARQYTVQMKYRGFMRALLSTLRYGPLQTMEDAYVRVGFHARPTLLIWGRDDPIMPYKMSRRVRAAMPDVEFHTVEGAGHAPHLEQPALVTRLLVDFLR